MSDVKRIKTTGDLRKFLIDMMVGVKGGHLDLDKASRITKLAGQVNENLYAEIKIARIRQEMNGEKMAGLGEMKVSAD